MTALGVEAAYSLCCGGSLVDVGVRDVSMVVASGPHGTIHATSSLSMVARLARGYGLQEAVVCVPGVGISVVGADDSLGPGDLDGMESPSSPTAKYVMSRLG